MEPCPRVTAEPYAHQSACVSTATHVPSLPMPHGVTPVIHCLLAPQTTLVSKEGRCYPKFPNTGRDVREPRSPKALGQQPAPHCLRPVRCAAVPEVRWPRRGHFCVSYLPPLLGPLWAPSSIER